MTKERRENMVKELMHDTIFLGQKSLKAEKSDYDVAKNLLDTLIAHKDECVGMAANMIGVKKQIICFDNDGEYMLMFNPEIVKFSDGYDTEESCLSLLGGPRKTKRYKKIKVKYQDENFKVRIKNFENFTAQIIQHEIDHCNGILI